MSLTYKQFWNRKTGAYAYVPSGRYGYFLNAIKKMVNYVTFNIRKYYVAHVTLTVADNIREIDHEHLHRTLRMIAQRLKRAGSEFEYLWVKEFQERGAVHYHLLCVYSKPHVFPSSADIQNSWGLGFVKITAPKVRMKLYKIAGYIGKYIGKGYEYDALQISRSDSRIKDKAREIRRRFGASQIRQIYKLGYKRLHEVIREYGIKKAEQLKCTYRKVFEVNNDTKEKTLIKEFESDWQLMFDIHEKGYLFPRIIEEPF